MAKRLTMMDVAALKREMVRAMNAAIDKYAPRVPTLSSMIGKGKALPSNPR